MRRLTTTAICIIALSAIIAKGQNRWTPLGGEYFTAAAYGGACYWVGSSDGKLIKSPDGLEWASVGHRLSQVNGLLNLGGAKLLACGSMGHAGSIERSQDAGKTWQLVFDGSTGILTALGCNGGDTVLSCGRQGLIFRSTDGGTSWSSVPSDHDSDLLSITFASRLVAYCATEDGAVLKSTDGGATWAKTKLPGAHQLTSVLTIGDSIVLSGDDHGHLFRSSNAGLTWDSVTPSYGISRPHIFELGTRLYAVGDAGSNMNWFYSTDTGRTWLLDRDSIMIPIASFFSAAVRDSTRAIRVGSPGLIQYTSDAGVSWVTSAQSILHFPLLRTDLHAMACFDSSTFLAFGDHNRVLRTTDGGITWRSSAIYSDSIPPEDRGLATDAIALSSDTAIVIGNGTGNFGMGYFKTTNAGVTWIANHAFDNHVLWSISSSDRGHLAMVVDDSLERSNDGGETWSVDTVFSKIRPGRVSLSIDSGYLLANWATYPIQIPYVFWTADGGAHWREFFSDTIPWQASVLGFRNRFDGYMRYPNGVLLHTTNGCVTWDTIHTGFGGLIYDVLMLSDSVGFAVGQNLTILSTTDGWKTIVHDSVPKLDADPSQLTLFRLYRFENRVYAIGQQNIYRLNLDQPKDYVSEYGVWGNPYLYVSVYPNPSATRTSITVYGLYSIKSPSQTLVVHDLLGREVMNLTPQLINNSDGISSTVAVDLQNLPSGAYEAVYHGSQWAKSATIVVLH